MADVSVRDGVLLTLEGRGPILDTARDVTRIMRDAGVDAAVIGGVAVVLHGHLRTTRDVDVYVGAAVAAAAEALQAAGYTLDAARREFVRADTPVQLVTDAQTAAPQTDKIEIEGIRTVGLADLISMKLRSGTRDVLRAQDLADVIGLIRVHNLRGNFAARLARGVRAEFRKFAKAVAERG